MKVIKLMIQKELRNFNFAKGLSTVRQFESADYSVSQIDQLDENIILVNENDDIVGSASKYDTHVRSRHNTDAMLRNGILHRAFSVFLFNSKKELLLQQRSSSKITFPNYFTNSCCSHPRYNAEEIIEENCLGVKLAAQRRLKFELGIEENEVPIESLNFFTRVHYSAKADENWGEHELDYVLVCQTDVTLDNINEDEVQSVSWLNQNELRRFLNDAEKNNILITPWFNYISKKMLFKWWDNLDDINRYKDNIIHRAGLQ